MRTIRVRAVIPHDGKFLFVQHNHDDSYWALPGGKLEDGESLQQGLSRELVEELGIKPRIGTLLYVQQLRIHGHESLEFFFEILNGADYTNIQLDKTSHGTVELARATFIEPATKPVRPLFLKELEADMAAAAWPKIFDYLNQVAS